MFVSKAVWSAPAEAVPEEFVGSTPASWVVERPYPRGNPGRVPRWGLATGSSQRVPVPVCYFILDPLTKLEVLARFDVYVRFEELEGLVVFVQEEEPEPCLELGPREALDVGQPGLEVERPLVVEFPGCGQSAAVRIIRGSEQRGGTVAAG